MTPDTTLLAKAFTGIVKFYQEYKGVINVGVAFILITLIIIFIINVAKLSTSNSSPMKRQEAIHGIIVTGICFALMGASSLIFYLILGLVFFN